MGFYTEKILKVRDGVISSYCDARAQNATAR